MFKNRAKGTFIDIQPISNLNLSLDENAVVLDEIRSLPFRLTLEINMDGVKLYSSPELKKKYVEIMKEEKKTNPIASILEKLVAANLITPCWMNKSLYKFIKFKLFGDYATKGVLGFYSPKHHRIILLMDNNVDISLKRIWNLGKASNHWLSILTLHEGMHMFAKTVKGKFLKFFQKELDLYYSYYFQEVFQLQVSPDVIKGSRNLYTMFYKQFESSNRQDPNKYFSMVSKMLDINFRKISKFNSDEFEKRIRDYLTFGVIAMNDVNRLFSLVNSGKYDHIFKPFYSAYKKAFGMKDVSSFCFQEMWAPSEAIAILAEGNYSSSKIISAYSQIK